MLYWLWDGLGLWPWARQLSSQSNSLRTPRQSASTGEMSWPWRRDQGGTPQDPPQSPGITSNLAHLHSHLVAPHFNEKTSRLGPWSPLRNLRSSKHFKTGDLAESLCTFSMYNKGRVGESTYFSTKMSGFIRVSCSRKAKGNKTQRNTNKDSHYQPFKYTDHTSVVYIFKKRKCTFYTFQWINILIH